MDELSESLTRRIEALTGWHGVTLGPVVQSLWSGYGRIQKLTLATPPHSPSPNSYVIKYVDTDAARPSHPRNWGGHSSHQRKIKSYEVERNFYALLSDRCNSQRTPTSHSDCRVAQFIAADAHSPGEATEGNGWLLILEDLDAAGFAARRQTLTAQEMGACLRWLANFHARFISVDADRLRPLWPVGTYWHLATRQEEFDAMEAGPLKDAAHAIDQKLNQCQFSTLVHGDAKVANFCFADHGNAVAAVDFQYVGRGCGMKDVAYFLSSCLSDQECADQQNQWLEVYFETLASAIKDQHPQVKVDHLEREWRELYRYAWADFYRFLAGWSPGHWKMHGYSDRLTQTVIDELNDA